MSRYPHVVYEPPVDGETAQEKNARVRRNRKARRERDEWWATEGARLCAICGYAYANVVHNVDPADQIEGPDYYASMTDLHEFRLATLESGAP